VGGLTDQAALGVSAGASAGFNPLFDLERPPRFTVDGRYLTLSFPHADWGAAAAGDYAVDVRGGADGAQVWDFVVRTNVPLASVSLAWPDVRAVNPNLDLVLVDVDANQRRSLRSSSGYAFQTGPNGAERRFRVVVRNLASRRASP
jgi:hypothetical protein